jgi:non-canonical purine NTP pyrophosphatase (RdgB/HAM1 family)
MLGKITFGTTNQGKLDEAREILKLDVSGVSLEIPEIQSLDNKEVAIAKAKAYWEKLKKPLFIEDISLVFNTLNSLPGTYIDSFSKALDNKGLISLLKSKKDKSAKAITTLVYIWAKDKYEVFEGMVEGKISAREKGKNGFGWDPIFVPIGSNKTFAQMSQEEKNKYSMRAKALKKLSKWIKGKQHANRTR